MSKSTRPTISDVAKAAKTGKTSISRYLNGEKHLLSDALLARIEHAIAELDYRPSLMARGLKHGRTRLIGLIIADITNPYSVNVLSGIEAACREKGFTPLVCNTNNEVDQELHYLDLLRSYQVEGIVFNAVGMREEGLNRLQQSALPMVLIDRKIPDFACDVVGLDNTQAATTATEHLIEQGFEAILFLSEPLGMVNTRRERLSAFRTTLARYAGVVAENVEIPLHESEQLDNALRQFHTRHRGMRKAVISANGALTLQVARSLKRIGLHWGSDIGLLGFDELEWAELAGVGITTLKQRGAVQGVTLAPFAEFWEANAIVEMPASDENAKFVRFADFRRDPENHPLKTESGKIVIHSERIASFNYADCPPHPMWLEPDEWQGNAEPEQLQVLSAHPAHRLHSQLNYSSLRDQYAVAGREPVTLHPDDAKARGIADGDVVRVWNHRGQVLAGAVVSDGIKPGVICIHQGAWPDLDAENGGICKNGAVNVLTKDLPSSKLGNGCAGNTALAWLEKYQGPTLTLTAFDPPASS